MIGTVPAPGNTDRRTPHARPALGGASHPRTGAGYRRSIAPLAAVVLGGIIALLAATRFFAPGETAGLALSVAGDAANAAATHNMSSMPGMSDMPADQSMGLTLAADHTESVTSGPGCADDAPVRSYDVNAINVDITVNRYLDHDPQGRMYALAADIPRVRDEEASNAAARETGAEPAVSVGLQGDAIQPLTLRVTQGECLRIHLTNDLNSEPATLHIHGSPLRIAGTDEPAIATNPHAVAQPGASVDYEWMVRDDEPEGTHDFHSHGDDRGQTSHGLFGAVIVEPKGATVLDPRTGQETQTGWDAVVKTDAGAFREFVLYYHEIGNENYQLLDRRGQLVPQVDPLTSAYRPDGRALNYRSEPFMNRLALQQGASGTFDESLAYSSYAFGDPATPMLRSYVGDPVKQRLVHGGSEVIHVHHVHGGAVRWLRQPNTRPSLFDTGLDKHPPLTPVASERTDAQSLGPSETFDIEDECGSGGCQQSVGDFLVHCHVAHHYFAGMWTIWRVYNTTQDGVVSTDALPPLPELPGRTGRIAAAVTASALQRLVSARGEDRSAWVERQLPPPGVPHGYDASVLDWVKQGDDYLNEPETRAQWPGYRARAPGERPPILFDPNTGKLAYPMLRPHLGARPPFAPNHGPAPYLDPVHDGDQPPAPGANGPASVCPDGTKPLSYAVNAITLPITINAANNLVDSGGEIFVLRDQEDQARADNNMRVPLAIRANAGEDCIDVVLRSELEDSPENHGFAKVNLHVHFAQFDVQASDGVDAGFNYEQSIRPYGIEGERLPDATASGATAVRVTSATRFQPGILVGIGVDQDATFEVRRIISIEGDRLTLDVPIEHPHGAGEIVSTEFVRYRWYPDAQFGTAYFHDHVNALASWKHGLFGALIAEPPGSTYHDPVTGDALRSGAIADIHTTKPVSVDVSDSFRELALFVQDENPLTHVGRSTGSSFNLRAEPLANRGTDPTRVFSSTVNGDPATPLFRAYTGDPVVLRTLVGGTNDTHTVHVDGHWFRSEPYSSTSPPIDTIHLGISERYDLAIPAAGGPQGMPGDYLYRNGRAFKLREGSWGVFRVLGKPDPSLQPLPGRTISAPPASVCPDAAPRAALDVAAIPLMLPTVGDDGKIFVLQSQKQATLDGTRPPEPLILHVNVGDCITIVFANDTESPVSLHADMLAYDPADSGGIEVGNEPPQDVAPGAQRTYTYYASPEVGETVAQLSDGAEQATNPGLGLYGAIVVGPAGATYSDPESSSATVFGWSVIAHPPGASAYRDFTLMFQDEDETIGSHRMPYTTKVGGPVAINYEAAPLSDRAGADTSDLYRSDVHGDPATPQLQAYAGDPVRLHVVAPWSEQAQVFSLEGHRWPVEPGRIGTNEISSVQIGGLEAITIIPQGGAGGVEHLPGDYLYGDHREPYREAGLWGIFRVYRAGSSASLRPLPGAVGTTDSKGWPLWQQAALMTVLFLPVLIWVLAAARADALMVTKRRGGSISTRLSLICPWRR